MTPRTTLLAIDLGLRFGWAAFGGHGLLLQYGSRHFGTRASLRKAIRRSSRNILDSRRSSSRAAETFMFPGRRRLRGAASRSGR
jgi:hypothetical protein